MSNRACLIVPTFSQNSSSIIDGLINETNNQTLANFDLIIVNNNTYPLDITNQFKKGEVFILNGKKNLGSAWGFYLGMKYAHNKGYDFYILGDDDAKLIDKDLFSELVSATSHDKNSVFRPFWKERSTEEDIEASISCFWCLSNQTLNECWYYDPLFFYGWEDGAYGICLQLKKIQIKSIKHYFSHPVKPWLTYSRGSSWLSVFRHNSILQHYWTIFHSHSFREIITSLLLNTMYIMSIFYGLILFTPYFKSQLLFNIRNIFLYIPPILFFQDSYFFYPKYKDASSDAKCERILKNQTDIISTNYKKNYFVGSKVLCIDSWFPFAWKNKIFLLQSLFQYHCIGLIHSETEHEYEYKTLIKFKNTFTKFITILICIFITPIFLNISVLLLILFLIKYGLINFLLKFQERKYFEYFTT